MIDRTSTGGWAAATDSHRQPGVPVRPLFPVWGPASSIEGGPGRQERASRTFGLHRDAGSREAKAAGRPADPRSLFYLANAAGASSMRQRPLSCTRTSSEIRQQGDRWAAAYHRRSIWISASTDPSMHRMAQMLPAPEAGGPSRYFGAAGLPSASAVRCFELLWFEVGKTFPTQADPAQLRPAAYQCPAFQVGLTAIKRRQKDLMSSWMRFAGARRTT